MPATDHDPCQPSRTSLVGITKAHPRPLRLVSLFYIVLTALATLTLLVPQHSIAGSITRTSSFEYNDQGILTKEIVEPNASTASTGANICLQTSYTYDLFGNKTSATTSSCAGGASRSSKSRVGFSPPSLHVSILLVG